MRADADRQGRDLKLVGLAEALLVLRLGVFDALGTLRTAEVAPIGVKIDWFIPSPFPKHAVSNKITAPTDNTER